MMEAWVLMFGGLVFELTSSYAVDTPIKMRHNSKHTRIMERNMSLWSHNDG
jgi:hypothetical protein